MGALYSTPQIGRGRRADQPLPLPSTTGGPATVDNQPKAVPREAQSANPLQPWNAPLDGPAPDGYTRVGNQWSYTGTSDQFQTQYPDAAKALGMQPPAQPAAPDQPAAPEQPAVYQPPSGGGGWLPPGGGAQPASDGMDALMRQKIIDLLNTKKGVDPASLRKSSEFQAGQMGAQRAEERDRAALAERAAQEGWSSSGAFEGDLQGLRQQRGETEMRLLSTLAGQEIDRQRDDLKQGLDYAMRIGDRDSEEKIRRELANLEAETQRQGYASAASTAANDQALRRWIAEQDQAFNYSELEARMNAQSAQATYGGYL